jgi:hypothetical protein
MALFLLHFGIVANVARQIFPLDRPVIGPTIVAVALTIET